MNVNIDIDNDEVKIENNSGDKTTVTYHEWLQECREQRDQPVVHTYADKMASLLAGRNLLSQSGIPVDPEDATIVNLDDFRNARA